VGKRTRQFNIQDETVKRAEETHSTDNILSVIPIPTLGYIAEVLLHKSGGYITNDVAPPGVLLDNISNWEYGALWCCEMPQRVKKSLCKGSVAIREDADLRCRTLLYYEHNSWALPSTEAEYQKGIDALHKYMSRLQNMAATLNRRNFIPEQTILAVHRGCDKTPGGLLPAWAQTVPQATTDRTNRTWETGSWRKRNTCN